MNGCINLTNEQINTITTNLLSNRTHSIRDMVLFVLGTRTGFRISELLSIKVSDIVIRENVGYVTVKKANTKGRIASRSIPISEQTLSLCKELISAENLGSGDYLFKSQKGNGAITRVQAHRIIKNACGEIQATGKVATHSMRKTFANNVYAKTGNDILKTQLALGHVNVNSTSKYISVDREEVHNIIMQL